MPENFPIGMIILFVVVLSVILLVLSNVKAKPKERISPSGKSSAGYVYVISNKGSFGADFVKIGMTTRNDPLVRIKELSGAAVPFPFQVHILHYSENAYAVEQKLHQTFKNRKVNLTNLRREHFWVTPAEVHEELLKIGGTIEKFDEHAAPVEYEASLRKRNSARRYQIPSNFENDN